MKRNLFLPVAALCLTTLLTACGAGDKAPKEPADTAVQASEPAAEAAPVTEEATPEAAVADEETGGKTEEKAPVAGANVVKGANLVAVLKAAGNVTYEYNADNGIWATIGSVAVVISEDDLNEKGVSVISKLTSDIEPDVPLTPDCFKPSAKVKHIEKL